MGMPTSGQACMVAPGVPPAAALPEPGALAGLQKTVRRWGPFLVPVVYLLLVTWMQPAERLGAPTVPRWLGRLLYDDYDWTALAVRGVNVHLGRTPGRADDPCIRQRTSGQFAQELRDSPPLEPRYFLEYPYVIAWLAHQGYAIQPGAHDLAIPPAVADACYHQVVEHLPDPDNKRCDEPRLWATFRRAIQTYEAGMILCLLTLMAVLHWGYEAGSRLAGPVALLLLPGALYFALNRFDIIPALLTALSLACLGRRKLTASAVLLGVAASIKVYPILFAPLFLRYLLANRRQARAWALAFGTTVASFLVLPLLQFDAAAVWGPYRFQLSRQLEGYTLYGLVIPQCVAGPDLGWRLVRTGSVLATAFLLCWHRPAGLEGLLRRCAVVALVFVALQVFYSPQWLLWFSPFLIPLAGRQRSIARLVLALDLVNYLTFPVVYDRLGSVADPGYQVLLYAGLIYGRFLIQASLVGVLLRAEFRRQPA